MKNVVNTSKIWEQNQHLNFGEIQRVVAAAEQAVSDAVWNETKNKIAKAGAKQSK